MTELLTYVLVGIGIGSVYSIAAMGLVLTFKTSGVFNFAQGAIAAVGAGLFYELRTRDGVPWPLALVITLVVCGLVIGLFMERLARELVSRSIASQIAAMVGVLVGLQAAVIVVFGASPLNFPAYLPTNSIQVGGVLLGIDKIIIAVLALALLMAMTVFLGRSRTGLAMSAVVRDPELLDLTGVSPVRVRRLAWVIGSSFAALSGVLLAPSIGFNATTLTLLVVQAFGAAAIGGFVSLPLTYLGSLILGVGSTLAQRYASGVSGLEGLAASLPFIILFLVLTFTPKSRLQTVTLGAGRAVSGVELLPVGAARYRRAGSIAVVVAFLAVAPAFAGSKLPVYSAALVYVLLFLSLAVLIRLSGQVSLSVVGFAAIGATTFGHLLSAGVPWVIALILAGLTAVPVGAMIAIPAIRLPGIFLALASLGFGILLERLVYPTGLMFGGSFRVDTRRPDGLTGDTQYYYVLFSVVLLTCVLVAVMQRSRLGRLLRGMAQSPLALTTHGLSVPVTRLLVFALAAFIAALGGALYGPITGAVTGGGSSPFQALNSLSILAILFVSGRDAILSSFIGAIFFVLPAYANDDTLTEYYPIIFGILVIAAALRSADAKRTGSPLAGRTGTRIGRGPAHARWNAFSTGKAAAPGLATVAHRRRRSARSPVDRVAPPTSSVLPVRSIQEGQ